MKLNNLILCHVFWALIIQHVCGAWLLFQKKMLINYFKIVLYPYLCNNLIRNLTKRRNKKYNSCKQSRTMNRKFFNCQNNLR